MNHSVHHRHVQLVDSQTSSPQLSSAANEVASNPASFFLFLGEAGFEATNEDALKLGYPITEKESVTAEGSATGGNLILVS